MQWLAEFLPIGRIGRSGFWWRHLLLPLMLAATIAGAPAGPWGALLALATTLFLVSTWGRRLHDRGHSAWWLAAALLPIVGALLLWVECGLRGTRRDASAPPSRPSRSA